MFYRSLHHGENKQFPFFENNIKSKSICTSRSPRIPPPNIPFFIFGAVFFYLVIRKM